MIRGVIAFVAGWIVGALCAGRYVTGIWPWQVDDRW